MSAAALNAAFHGRRSAAVNLPELALSLGPAHPVHRQPMLTLELLYRGPHELEVGSVGRTAVVSEVPEAGDLPRRLLDGVEVADAERGIDIHGHIPVFEPDPLVHAHAGRRRSGDDRPLHLAGAV